MNYLKIIIPVALLGGTFVYLNDTDRTVRACMKRIQPIFAEKLEEQTKASDGSPAGQLGVALGAGLAQMMMEPMVRSAVLGADDPMWLVHLRCMTASDDDLREGLK